MSINSILASQLVGVALKKNYAQRHNLFNKPKLPTQRNTVTCLHVVFEIIN